MKQVDQTKSCWSCEADVSFEATYCPFCGTDLLTSTIESATPSKPPSDKKFSNHTLQESLASLYKPPYSVRNQRGLGVPDEREESSFKKPPQLETKDPFEQTYEQMEISEQAAALPQNKTLDAEDEGDISRRGSILPLLFLMIGAHLFMLGALLLFCSKDGFVNLQWNSRFWFLYCLMGLPLLIFGGKMVNPKQDR